jgi:hypothetical protein
MTFEEPREHMVFGLSFTATNTEQRSVWLAMCRSSVSRQWGPLHHAVKHCYLEAHDPKTVDLLQRLELAEAAMTELAAKLIADLERRRDIDGSGHEPFG